jgi:hypothetical protein
MEREFVAKLPEKTASLLASLKSWKQERVAAHEAGHTPEPIDTFYPEGQGTEIELFNPTRIRECLDTQVSNSPFEITS